MLKARHRAQEASSAGHVDGSAAARLASRMSSMRVRALSMPSSSSLCAGEGGAEGPGPPAKASRLAPVAPSARRVSMVAFQRPKVMRGTSKSE